MSGEGTAHWQCKINQRPLGPDVMKSLLELEVVRRLEHASRFCLKLSDPDYTLADGTIFPLGGAVEISLQHAGHEVLAFEGEITAWGLECTASGTALLVRGLDRSHRLLRSRRIRFIEARDDAGLVGALARDHGLTGPPGGGKGQGGHLQLGASDLSLLMGRGERQAITPGLEGKRLHLKPVNDVGLPVTLQDGQGLGRFELVGELSTLPTTVQVTGWDMRQHRRVEGKATAAEVRWSGTQARMGVSQAKSAFGEAVQLLPELQPTDAQEARSLAQSWLKRQAEAALQGVVWVRGFPALEPGQRVKLDSPSLPLPGVYRVTGIHYLLTAAGGSTRLEVRRPHLQS